MADKNSYGIIGTLMWSLLILIAYMFVQGVIAAYFAASSQLGDLSAITPEQMETVILDMEINGNAIAWAATISGLMGVALVFLAAKSKRFSKINEYLAIKSVSAKTLLVWVLAFAVVLLISEGLTYGFGKDSVTEDMVGIYRSATTLWLLWVALVITAPLFEELFFRGFMFKGLSESVIGAIGATIITSAIWAIIHVQYEAFYIVIIFFWGLFIGWARHKTGSILVPIVLHMMANLIATIQTHMAI